MAGAEPPQARSRKAPARHGKLLFQTGPLQGKVALLRAGTQVKVGRGETCEIRLDEPRVSRCHCTVVSTKGGFAIYDNKSNNGTYVNRKRVEKKLLADGDTIRIGQSSVVYFVAKKDPLVGKTIAGYRIIERLGRGASGAVYIANQTTMGRLVALKIPSQELASDEAFVAKFVEEARSMAKVENEHVVRVHTAGQDGELFYLAMEYMPGGSLRQRVQREGAIPPERAVSMLLDATRALMWAEGRLVHRDIKPDNLLIDADECVKIGDFGIAASLSSPDVQHESRRITGSPKYMAPEQAFGKSVDHRADIYALGSTLYYALSGRAPYEGDKAIEIVRMKRDQPPTPLSPLVPEATTELVEVVERMMARDPGDRFQNAREVFAALSAAQDGIVDAARRQRRGANGRGDGHRLSGKRTAKVPFWASVALVIIASVLLYLGSIDVEQPESDFADRLRLTKVKVSRNVERGEFEKALQGLRSLRPDAQTKEDVAAIDERLKAVLTEQLAAVVESDVASLLIESRFADATERLAKLKAPRTPIRREIDTEIRTVESAGRLFRARSAALAREKESAFDEAKKILRNARRHLVEPYRTEATTAMESLPSDPNGLPNDPAGLRAAARIASLGMNYTLAQEAFHALLAQTRVEETQVAVRRARNKMRLFHALTRLTEVSPFASESELFELVYREASGRQQEQVVRVVEEGGSDNEWVFETESLARFQVSTSNLVSKKKISVDEWRRGRRDALRFQEKELDERSPTRSRAHMLFTLALTAKVADLHELGTNYLDGAIDEPGFGWIVEQQKGLAGNRIEIMSLWENVTGAKASDDIDDESEALPDSPAELKRLANESLRLGERDLRRARETRNSRWRDSAKNNFDAGLIAVEKWTTLEPSNGEAKRLQVEIQTRIQDTVKGGGLFPE